jgi:hypothetical protein
LEDARENLDGCVTVTVTLFVHLHLVVGVGPNPPVSFNLVSRRNMRLSFCFHASFMAHRRLEDARRIPRTSFEMAKEERAPRLIARLDVDESLSRGATMMGTV